MFPPGQGQNFNDMDSGALPGQVSIVTSWFNDGYQQTQTAGAVSESLNWPSLFKNADPNGELFDYFETFSEPFLG